jgi:AcrR family transcriptional regulator
VLNPKTFDASGAPNLRERILDTALALAEDKGRWSAVRLHDVADRLSISVSQVLDHYRDLDAVADAWFLRGLRAMVGPKPPDFLEQPEWRRIELCILAWFDTLAAHQRVSVQMLRGKLHLSHPHHAAGSIEEARIKIRGLESPSRTSLASSVSRRWRILSRSPRVCSSTKIWS